MGVFAFELGCIDGDSQAGLGGMSLKGKWRIVEMLPWDKDFLDLVEPAYILLGETEGEFAFRCVTGSFGGAGDSEAIAFN